MNVANKRNYERIDFECPVDMDSPKGSWRSQLRDISFKGLLVTAPEDWSMQVGEKMSVVVHLGEEDPLIKMDATIVHEESGQVGFSWDEIDLISLGHLRRLVELNVADADELKRELLSMIDSWIG